MSTKQQWNNTNQISIVEINVEWIRFFVSSFARLTPISLQLLSYIWNEQKYLNCRLSYSRYGKYIFFLFCQSLSLHKREEEENKCLAIFRCQWRMPLYNLYKMLIFQHPYNYWYDTKAIYRVSRKGMFFILFSLIEQYVTNPVHVASET